MRLWRDETKESNKDQFEKGLCGVNLSPTFLLGGELLREIPSYENEEVVEENKKKNHSSNDDFPGLFSSDHFSFH